MADTIKTVKPAGGGDYSSLSAWDAGQAKTIATGDREIAECYGGEDTSGNNFTLSASWDATASGAAIIIRAASGNQHTGSPSTGYRLTGTNTYLSFSLGGKANVELNGLVIWNKSTGADNGRVALSCYGAANALIKSCLIYRDTTSVYAALNLTGAGFTGAVINTIVITPGLATNFGIGFPAWARCYNCAFISTDGNPALTFGYGSALFLKNCYLHSTGTCLDDIGYGTLSVVTGRHSTTQSITGSTGSTAYSTTNFADVTAGSEDLSLPSGSALIDAGTDLSGDADYPFSTDILGATRSGTWEVGPFNYAAPTGGPAPKCWFDEELELAA